MMRRPCSDCPWRKDAPAGYWHPEHFRDIWQSCQDDGLNVMLCHKAAKLPEAERGSMPCQGWARVQGGDSIGVRIALMNGELAREEVLDRDGPELFETFEDMMAHNEIELPPRNQYLQR